MRERILLRILGPFAIVHNGTSTLRISARKGCALLAYLAMHPQHPLSREHLATALWGDRRDVNARQSLRQCILSLRHDLGPTADDVLIFDGDKIALNTQRLTVDAVEFKTLAQSCAEPADARGASKQALSAAERLIALDWLREDWQRVALRIFARHRGRAFAMRHFDVLASQLRSELGVDPEPESKALIDAINRGLIVEPDLPPSSAGGATPTMTLDPSLSDAVSEERASNAR